MLLLLVLKVVTLLVPVIPVTLVSPVLQVLLVLVPPGTVPAAPAPSCGAKTALTVPAALRSGSYFVVI